MPLVGVGRDVAGLVRFGVAGSMAGSMAWRMRTCGWRLAACAVFLCNSAEAVRLASAAVESAGTSPPAMVTARKY